MINSVQIFNGNTSFTPVKHRNQLQVRLHRFHGKIGFGFLLAFAVLLLPSCSSRPDWSDADLKNFVHYDRAKAFTDEEARIINEGGDQGLVFVTDAVSDQILSLRQNALSECRKLKDSVLAKAHPDLPKHFREEYQKSLELWTEGRQSLSDSLYANVLMDRYIDWANAHKKEFRVPRRIEEFEDEVFVEK